MRQHRYFSGVLPLLALLVLTGGCGLLESAEEVPVDEAALDVQVRVSEVVLGESAAWVVTAIRNGSRQAVYLDPCRHRLEAEDQAGWVSLRESHGCKAAQAGGRSPGELMRIGPGRTHVDTVTVGRHPTLSYRYRYQYFLTDPEGDLLPLEKTQTGGFVIEPVR